MNSEIEKKVNYDVVIRNLRMGGNITVKISEGEFTCVCRWGVGDTHDLIKHPNWDHVEDALERILEYESERFIEISKLLKPRSQGAKCVRKVVQKHIDEIGENIKEKEAEIAKISEEVQFWKEFI